MDGESSITHKWIKNEVVSQEIARKSESNAKYVYSSYVSDDVMCECEFKECMPRQTELSGILSSLQNPSEWLGC